MSFTSTNFSASSSASTFSYFYATDAATATATATAPSEGLNISYEAASDSKQDVSSNLHLNTRALLLLLVPVLTLVGNSLVVMSILKERMLRTNANYYVLSLAVADINVGIVVMPLAIYLEVNNGEWLLSHILCDIFVACDVLFSTASILNLTAICIDRFVAVTFPIEYSKQMTKRQIVIVILITWLLSLGIAAPVVCGLNRSEGDEPVGGDLHDTLCTLRNPEYIIASSLGSFIVPTCIVIPLYIRIFVVIRRHSIAYSYRRKTTMQSTDLQSRLCDQYGADQECERERARILASAREDLECISQRRDRQQQQQQQQQKQQRESEWDLNCGQEEEERERVQEHGRALSTIPKLLVNDVTISPEISHTSPRRTTRSYSTVEIRITPIKTYYGAAQPERHELNNSNSSRETESHFSRADRLNRCRSERQRPVSRRRVSPSSLLQLLRTNRRHSEPNWSRRSSTRAMRRETKATLMLAIVLIVYLACWMPFFIVNMLNAINIKTQTMIVPPWILTIFVWLGYANSTLNPIIYGLFNTEYRRAFKRLLCPRDTNSIWTTTRRTNYSLSRARDGIQEYQMSIYNNRSSPSPKL